MNQNNKNKILKDVCAYALSLIMLLSFFTNLAVLKAEPTVVGPNIINAKVGDKIVSGISLMKEGYEPPYTKGIIHLTLKDANGDIKLSKTFKPDPNTYSREWEIDLGQEIEPGDTIIVRQEFKGEFSKEVIVTPGMRLSYKYKDQLVMPAGDFLRENPSSSFLRDDEKNELLEMVKKANPSIANDIIEVNATIKDKSKAYITITYRDHSKSESILAENLIIKPFTEHSRGASLNKILVTDRTISGQVLGEGPFENLKAQLLITFKPADEPNLYNEKRCIVSGLNSGKLVDVDIEPNTGKFVYHLNENDNKRFKINTYVSVLVKEKHKFNSCASVEILPALPDKIGVKNPRKLTDDDKTQIDTALRNANMVDGFSKLSIIKNGVYVHPSLIDFDDNGDIRIINPDHVEYESTPASPRVPKKNNKGQYILINKKNLEVITIEIEKLIKNLEPDAPKIENNGSELVISPNLEMDTDAKKIFVTFIDKNDKENTVVAIRSLVNGQAEWTIEDPKVNPNISVNSNGYISIPTDIIKLNSFVTSYVEDEGGLAEDDKALASEKSQLKIVKKCKLSYDSGQGTGTVSDELIDSGTKYTLADSLFTPPKYKKFSHWMVASEVKNPGDEIEINDDTVIKAIYKYIVDPKISQIETIVGHPVDYSMYKNALSELPQGVTVEQIKVLKAPNILEVGNTTSEIEVIFSNEHYRTLVVPVNVKADSKDDKIQNLEIELSKLKTKLEEVNATILENNKRIKDLNSKISELDTEKTADKRAYEKAKTELETKLKESQISLKEKEEELDDIKNKLEKANKELSEEKNKAASLSEQVKTKDEKITSLEKEINELKTQLENTNKNKANLIVEYQAKIKEKEAEIERLNSEKKDLADQLQSENTKNENLEKQLIELNAKVEQTDKDLKNANEKINDLEKQLAAEKEINKNLTEEIGKLFEDLKSKTSEVDALTSKVSVLANQIDKLTFEKNKNKENYEKSKAELQVKLDLAAKELSKKSEEINEIKTELEKAKNNLTDEKAKNIELTEEVKEKEEQINNLEDQLKSLKEKVNKASYDLESANNRIKELEKELANKETENKDLTEQIERLGKDLEIKINEVNNLNTKIVELEKQVSENISKSETDAKEIERLNNELKDVKTKLTNKSSEVNNLNNEINSLKEVLEENKSKNIELTNTVEKLEKEAQELKEKIKSSESTITDLQKKNSTLTEKLKAEKETNKNLQKEKEKLEKDKQNLEDKAIKLDKKVKEVETEKDQLTKDRENLQKELENLQEQLSKCPADQTDKIKELEDKIHDKEKLLEEKDKSIEDKNTIIEMLIEKLDSSDKKVKDLIQQIDNLESKTPEVEYIYVKDRESVSSYDYNKLKSENDNLKKQIQDLKNKLALLENNNNHYDFDKEKHLTIFSLDSNLYETYKNGKLVSQEKMTDSFGDAKPFVSNNRTMLPMRYIAESLGFDVSWYNASKTAIFTNKGNTNALNLGKVTVNTDSLEMRDQYGKLIDVDSKPIIKDGRIYISITNLIKAFGGSNGNLEDGIKNTVEWDQNQRRVLVYKYIN